MNDARREMVWAEIARVASENSLDRLPHERDLDGMMELFGMCRHATRQRIRLLLDRGLITRRRGHNNRWLYSPMEK